MSELRGTIQNGQVVLDSPADLPNGTEVTVLPTGSEYAGVGIREEDWPNTPTGIAALVAKMDQIQPLTPEEELAWHKALAEQKAWEFANWDAHCKKIENVFK